MAERAERQRYEQQGRALEPRTIVSHLPHALPEAAVGHVGVHHRVSGGVRAPVLLHCQRLLPDSAHNSKKNDPNKNKKYSTACRGTCYTHMSLENNTYQVQHNTINSIIAEHAIINKTNPSTNMVVPAPRGVRGKHSWQVPGRGGGMNCCGDGALQKLSELKAKITPSRPLRPPNTYRRKRDPAGDRTRCQPFLPKRGKMKRQTKHTVTVLLSCVAERKKKPAA